jgi:uncharacterized membrane protein
MGVKHAEQQVVIEAAPESCFDALLEYETFPEWQSAVNWVDVITRDDKGRGREVHFEIDAKVKTVRYELEYSYEPPHRIAWRYLGGDIRNVDGEYIFEDRGDGSTLATYSLAMDPGIWLPDRIARAINRQVMRVSVEELRDRVERSGRGAGDRD